MEGDQSRPAASGMEGGGAGGRGRCRWLVGCLRDGARDGTPPSSTPPPTCRNKRVGSPAPPVSGRVPTSGSLMREDSLQSAAVSIVIHFFSASARAAAARQEAQMPPECARRSPAVRERERESERARRPFIVEGQQVRTGGEPASFGRAWCPGAPPPPDAAIWWRAQRLAHQSERRRCVGEEEGR